MAPQRVKSSKSGRKLGRWEEIIAGAYQKAGFDEVTLTSRSGDFGRDVIAVKHGLGTIRIIDQVKAYSPNRLVTADDVRSLPEPLCKTVLAAS